MVVKPSQRGLRVPVHMLLDVVVQLKAVEQTYHTVVLDKVCPELAGKVLQKRMVAYSNWTARTGPAGPEVFTSIEVAQNDYIRISALVDGDGELVVDMRHWHAV